jgi:hypothetical protein
MIGVLNDACTALMTSIGHQSGLFGTLATTGSATPAQVAEASGLNERYVREWLNAMTTARFIWYEPESHTYTLPREHAAWLVDGAGADSLARPMRFLPMLAGVEQGIVRCFREGGGLSYADYPRFHAVMAEALRPGGAFLMVDIRAASADEDNLDLPWATFLYTVSTMHCMTVSLGLDGDGLGTVWGEQVATRMLREERFTDVAVHTVEGDAFNNY